MLYFLDLALCRLFLTIDFKWKVINRMANPNSDLVPWHGAWVSHKGHPCKPCSDVLQLCSCFRLYLVTLSLIYQWLFIEGGKWIEEIW